MGDARVDVLNVTLPRNMNLVDRNGGLIDSFTFDSEGLLNAIGYVPASESTAYNQLALLSDGSFQLSAKVDTVTTFDGGGGFESMHEQVVRSVAQGNHRVEFDYLPGPTGQSIASANVVDKQAQSPLFSSFYFYNRDGRLGTVRRPNGEEIDISYDEDAIRMAAKGTVKLMAE